MNSFLKESQYDGVNDQDKKSESENHERKSKYLQYRSNNHIQESKDYPPSHIQLPTARRHNSRLSHTIIRQKVRHPKKYQGIRKNRDKDFHIKREINK